MGQFWIPGDSDFALAMREPNLLVPNKKPIKKALSKDRSAQIFLFNDVERFNDINGNLSTNLYSQVPITKDGAQFNGSSNYILVGDIANYTSGTPWSIFFSVKNITSTTDGKILSVRAGAYNANGFDVSVGSSIAVNGDVSGFNTFITHGVGDDILACIRFDGTNVRIQTRNENGTDRDQTGAVAYTPTSGNYACFCGRNHNVYLSPSGTVEVIKYYPYYKSSNDVNEFLFGNRFEDIICANQSPFLISVPAGGGTPTLSSPGVINVLSDRATPQVTLTF